MLPRNTRIALLGALAACLTGLSRGDVLLDWNALMIDGIRTDNSGPTLSTRNLTLLHVAIHDAVQSIVRTHQPYGIRVPVAGEASVEAAAASAGYEITSVLYPSMRARTEDLWRLQRTMAGDTSAATNGIAVGREAARWLLTSRAADGSQTEVPYIPSDLAGQWRRTPPFFRPPLTPHWRHVIPFCLPGLESFMPPPPPALDSVEYAEALNEVKAIGAMNSTVRTAEQGLIARFWSDFSYTSMPPGHWHLIAATIARDQGNTLVENARLFALLSMAQADAAILCWEVKFRHNLWRPVTAIHRADEDGNPLTEADPAWEQYLPSPPFPAYTSGHSTFSAASARVLTHFYGTDGLTFVATSDTLPGEFRTFHSLAACADEVGMSRIYGGFHFQFDNVWGKDGGRRIGDYVSAHFLLPEAELPTVWIEAWQDGVPQLRIHGRIGRPCRLQVSEDLEGWETILEATALSGGMTHLDTGAVGRATRFYRVVEE